MDTYEATKVVMSRIQSLDRENASKIMGYILIQDQGDKEMIRLAFVPEPLLLSYINQAKARLGIPSNTSSSNPPTPLSNPIRPNNPLPPRISIPSNGFHFSSPSSPASAFQLTSPSPSPRSFSYAAALNGGGTNSPINGSGSPILHFYSGGVGNQEHLPFPDEVDTIISPSGRSDSVIFPGDNAAAASPHSHPHPYHRRSCSVNDATFLDGGNSGGFGWRPCMYFARGFCKNGSACKFLHSDMSEVGSPSKNSHGFDEMVIMKGLNLQRQRHALMASRGHHPFGYYKDNCMDFLSENPRIDFSPMGMALGASSSSRQIYLTFPADSTFKEEDVSNYFNMFGPVQDVRIPYQHKRMFGFVTFIYPETVKLILAKGNPHFLCDSRVLVKPYKEKGKAPEQKQQQQHNLDLDLRPCGIDSREHIDLPLGSRMLLNSQEMMLRRKLEQEAELQHAIELQGRRMMDLQLLDLKNQSHDHHLLQSFSRGVPISSPRPSLLMLNQNFVNASDVMNLENVEESNCRRQAANSPDRAAEGTQSYCNYNTGGTKQQNVNGEDSTLPESFLPDNLFASPTKLAVESPSIFFQSSASIIPVTVTSSNNATPAVTVTSSVAISRYLQMPRYYPAFTIILLPTLTLKKFRYSEVIHVHVFFCPRKH